MTKHLALFDLDNTLLSGDSDYLWGQYLIEHGLVDGSSYASENRRYYEAYTAGTLDIREYLRFALRPLRDNDLALLRQYRSRFMAEKIEPLIPDSTRTLLQLHQDRGDEVLIITATNRFVTEPIAESLGVPHLLATDPEFADGRYTGEISGIPCFQAGKVQRLRLWLEQQNLRFGEQWFYSDSHNDLPLLEQVQHPVAVDPDEILKKRAQARGWPIVSLRHETGLAVFEKAVA